MLMTAAAAAAIGVQAAYDWQKPHAKALSDGDLAYAPEAWKEPKMSDARYIDFAGGDDARDGRSPATAWKHHPNDPAADGRAKGAQAATYVFKRGVTYRGKLTGRLANATLTSLPSYGRGKAVIAGSEPVPPSAWTKGGASGMPSPEKIWKAEIDHLVRAVWCRGKNGKWLRLKLARTPNWTYSNPDDVMDGWYQWDQPEWWTGKNIVSVNGHKAHLGINPEHLKGYRAADLVGGLVWSEWGIVMGTPFASKIESYDANRGAIAFQGFWYNDSEKIITKNRYFMEDRPLFLDEAGEFWFDRKGTGGTLYARFPKDADPKTLEVETSCRCDGLNLTEMRNVRITALDFERIGPHWRLEARPFEDGDIHGAAIRLNGSAVDVSIDHCVFSQLNAAIRIKAVKDDQEIDNLAITDNEIADCDQVAIDLGGSQRWGKNDGPYARTGAADILRNRIRRTGMRPARSDSGHSLSVSFIERLHLAGNFISRTCGAGIFVFGGKPDGDRSDCPYSRVMIHHNKVEDTLLMANDWGGIETWQGGPFYLWCNISKNPGGYWNWAAKPGHQRLGFAYYMDGSFKNYHFDNVALGKCSDPNSKLCNGSALYQATPTVLNAFYNGLYRTFSQGSGWNPQGGRHIFAGNRFEDISGTVFDHKAQKEDTGHEYGTAVLKDSIHMVGNSTPTDKSAHRRVRPFIPWSLARTVGEWNFRKGVPGLDEHWYMSSAMRGRFDYWKHPRNDLAVPDSASVVKGSSEDWIETALRLTGEPAVLKGRAVAAAPSVRAAPAPAASGLKTVKPCDWAEVTLPARPAFGKNLKAKITLKNTAGTNLVGKKLLFHWHWLKPNGWGGYISHVYLAPIVKGDGDYNVELINIPATEPGEFSVHSFLLGVSADDEITHSVRRASFTIDPSSANAPERSESVVASDAEWPQAVARHNLSVEAIVKTSSGGLVVSALDKNGFALGILAKGGVPAFRFAAGGNAVTVQGSTPVNDGKPHHLFAEVDRDAGCAVLYVDGRKAASQRLTPGMKDADASTGADLLVGKGFAGDIDFLRIAHSSLAESHTDIKELYSWEFSGPFLKRGLNP